MAVTLNLITVDFNAAPNPTVEFLQGRDMDVTGIRDTLRLIESSSEGIMDEGSPDLNGFIVKSSGNEFFNEAKGERNPTTVTILEPFACKFQSGAIPFLTSGGNFLCRSINSPGAIVQINNASGALSVNNADIEHASFGGCVTLHVSDGVAGTTGTIGNQRQHVNNIADAKVIGLARGLVRICFEEAVTLTSVDHIDGLIFEGINSVDINVVTIQSGATTIDTHFEKCTLQGTMSGRIEVNNCILGAITDMDYDSFLKDSLFRDDVTLNGGGSFDVSDCGAIPAPGITERPNFDYTNVSNARSNFLRWSGNIGFKGVTNGDISLNMSSGKVFIDASNAGGRIEISGDFELDNQSGGMVVVTHNVHALVVADAGNTASTFKTSLLESANDAHKNSLIQITSGVKKYEMQKISAYNGTTKFVTVVSPFSSTVTPGATIEVIRDKVNIANDTIGASNVETDAFGSLEFATDAVNEIRDAILADGTAFSGADILAIKNSVFGIKVKKGVALANFPFLMVEASDHITPKAGATVTAARSINGNTFDVATNSVVEVGFGYYKIDLSASDLNGDTVILKFSAVNADDRGIVIVTQP